jgi:3-oxoacyl-[acyl-carrier-protein] synthase II
MSGVPPRVVITGLGIASPLGSDIEPVWSALLDGRSGAARIEVDRLGQVTVFPVAGADDDARDLLGAREFRRMDRVGHLATLATAAALADAGDHGIPADRVGAVIGCVHGGAHTLDVAAHAEWTQGLDRVGPLTIPLGLTNGALAAVARTYGVRGPTSVTGTACAAGTDAIGLGRDWIRQGRADLVLAGGAEAPLVPLVIAGYRKLGALSRTDRSPEEASRPFDADRDGFVMAEAGAVLVLEEREHALRRGTTIYAEVTGFGQTCDAGHLTDPDPDGSGAGRAIALALGDAGIGPDEIGYVNAHATSTLAGDVAEARALVMAGLGDTPVSSTKAAIGHPLGAAGAVEAIVTALALHRQALPPTMNLEHPDPAIALRHVRTAEAAAIDAAMSNSFGFGGHNSCLVLRTPGHPDLTR